MRRILFVVAALATACVGKGGSNSNDEGTPADGDKEISLAEATAGISGNGKLMASFETPQGTIHCELFPDKAPKTVASFVGLARGLRPWLNPATNKWIKKPFYDGLAFHRVIATFMIQGGDPLSAKYDQPGLGTGGPGFTIDDELDPQLLFDQPGRLAMANRGPHTHTGSSQFFITEAPRPQLDHGYVIFGQCDDPTVVQAIARVPKGQADKPTVAQTMKVKIYKQ